MKMPKNGLKTKIRGVQGVAIYQNQTPYFIFLHYCYYIFIINKFVSIFLFFVFQVIKKIVFASFTIKIILFQATFAIFCIVLLNFFKFKNFLKLVIFGAFYSNLSQRFHISCLFLRHFFAFVHSNSSVFILSLYFITHGGIFRQFNSWNFRNFNSIYFVKNFQQIQALLLLFLDSYYGLQHYQFKDFIIAIYYHYNLHLFMNYQNKISLACYHY